MKKFLLTGLIAGLIMPFACASEPPSQQTMLEWYRAKAKKGGEKFDFEGDPVEIKLRNKETAYLVKVILDNAGRNDMTRQLLVRPELQEARLISQDYAMHVVGVHDLDNNGVSEVVTDSSASGQGTHSGASYILQFDGWSPIVLLESRYEGNGGYYEENHIEYLLIENEWEYIDLNRDGKLDVLETVTYRSGRNSLPPLVAVWKNRYLFLGDKFVKQIKFKR